MWLTYAGISLNLLKQKQNAQFYSTDLKLSHEFNKVIEYVSRYQ